MDPWYKQSRWKTKREHILRRDGYMCQLSKRYGINRPADMVHHVFPRDEFPEYAWSDWNLISLTNAMHDRLHDRSTRALTDDGVKLLRRIARKNNIPVPERYRDIPPSS